MELLNFFIDGKSQGIVAEAVYKLGHNRPSMRVPLGLVLRLTAGSKSISGMLILTTHGHLS